MTETSLHAALKEWYSLPNDRIEVNVDGYVIDILRGEELIEIQTRGFSSLRSKLEVLLEHHPVRLVHPIARSKWIVRETGSEFAVQRRRKSPKRGRIEDIFRELIYIPHLVDHPNFSLEILFTLEEENWKQDKSGSWRRRGWRIVNRKLLDVEEHHISSDSKAFLSLLPEKLPATFTTQHLAASAKIPRPLAQKMAYSLRQMGSIYVVERNRDGYWYATQSPDGGAFPLH